MGGNIIDVGLISSLPSFVAAFIQLSVREIIDKKLGTATQFLELGFVLTAIFTRARTMGVLNLLNYLSWAIGPTLGGILGEYTEIFLGVLTAIVIQTAGLLLLIRVPETAVH